MAAYFAYRRRSWQGFGHLLLRIIPPLKVADLGSGERLLSEFLAGRCKKVIAVDNSAFSNHPGQRDKMKNEAGSRKKQRLRDLDRQGLRDVSVKQTRRDAASSLVSLFWLF